VVNLRVGDAQDDEQAENVDRPMSAPPVLRRPPVTSARTGLELLSRDLHRDILKELAEDGPLTRSALAAKLHASATQVHECLQRLRGAMLVDSRRAGRAVEYSATPAGVELEEMTAIVVRWSRTHPGNPLTPSVGWRAFADFGEFWRVGLVEWIVRCSPAREDVARGLDSFPPSTLQETLDAMVEAGMVVPRKAREGRERHRLSPWAARGVGILAAIARWEARHEPPGHASIEVADAVVAFLATLPLVGLREEASGLVTFTVDSEREDGSAPRFGSVWAKVRKGRVVATGEGVPAERPAGWATGTFDAWLSACLDGRRRGVRRSGSSAGGIELVDAVVEDIHRKLML
jgi:DNA-binding HxlR family transcriptional regulator